MEKLPPEFSLGIVGFTTDNPETESDRLLLGQIAFGKNRPADELENLLNVYYDGVNTHKFYKVNVSFAHFRDDTRYCQTLMLRMIKFNKYLSRNEYIFAPAYHSDGKIHYHGILVYKGDKGVGLTMHKLTLGYFNKYIGNTKIWNIQRTAKVGIKGVFNPKQAVRSWLSYMFNEDNYGGWDNPDYPILSNIHIENWNVIAP